jgi:hypothetical protein
MVPHMSQPFTPEQWTAALARATKERLLAYPSADGMTWRCHGYTLRVTDPRKLASVECDCIAARHGRLCKHKATVVALWKHGLRPVPGTER